MAQSSSSARRLARRVARLCARVVDGIDGSSRRRFGLAQLVCSARLVVFCFRRLGSSRRLSASACRLLGSARLGSSARRHVGTSARRLTSAAIAPGRNAAADLCIHSDINVRQRRTWRTSHGPTNFGNGPTNFFFFVFGKMKTNGQSCLASRRSLELRRSRPAHIVTCHGARGCQPPTN